jgi:predicted nucleotidyltransferase
LSSKVYDEIRRVANKIQRIEGTIGIVLFGSYSRGDYEEGSDVDLLIVFEDKTALRKGSKDVYKVTAKSALFFQAICLTFNELCNSPLLESVRRDGKIYHANEDVKKLLASPHKPYALITYSTANLNPKERVIFTQGLKAEAGASTDTKGSHSSLEVIKLGEES